MVDNSDGSRRDEYFSELFATAEGCFLRIKIRSSYCFQDQLKPTMNVLHAWGKLDPIAIICLIVLIAMIFVAIFLLTITQRLAAQEVYDEYDEYSHALQHQRELMQQRRSIQTAEIMRNPESEPEPVPRTSARQSTEVRRSTVRDSTFDPYRVPHRKPLPNARSQRSVNSVDNQSHSTSTAETPASQQQMPLQHPPLYFQKSGYRPLPVFDEEGGDAAGH